MLSLLLVPSAWSADYTVVDVLSAWKSGMSDAVTAEIAEHVPAATETEKACLLAAGLPDGLVDRLPGTAGAALEPGRVAEVCGPLGLDPTVTSAAVLERRAAATVRRERRDQLAAAGAAVGCFRRSFAFEQEELEGWMRAQVREGAKGFVSVGANANDGGTTLLCSW